MKLCYLLLALFLAGCDNTQDTASNKTRSSVARLHISLDTPVAEFLEKSPVSFTADCLDAVNLCWYEADRQGALLDLSLSQPEGTLELDPVAGLQIAVDGHASSNIQALNINLRGLPDNSTHQANKELIYSLLEKLKSAGWQKYYFPSDPRISAVELKKLDWKESLLGSHPLSHPLFDANQEMSLDEWLGVGMFYDWYLYHGDYIAHVRALRYDSKDAPRQTGVYLISLNLSSQDRFWATDFAEQQRTHWKTLFPAHLKELLQRREAVETRARAVEVNIEDSYSPPLMERGQ
ncbi:lipoprotein [Pseudomonas protegens]|uniref:hypothetical protein n=1 Tax=Pseudomonas protegens TaxID=380021 RepID=UPI00098D06E6|nr:hypothetical protein [Pseudomonas protegens]AQT10187.1 lipoprotein [Pseudomonas protegens]GED73460.1 hypothetical protein PFL02_03100 [Pseudomonas fluorescens]